MKDSLVFYGEGDSGIMYNDRDLTIEWPMELIGGEQNLIISEKNTHLMSLCNYIMYKKQSKK